MEPLTAAVAAIESAAEVGAATGVAGTEAGVAGAEAGLALDASLESAVEATEAIVGEQGLIRQLDTVRFDSFEALSARNEAVLNEVFSIDANRKAGLAREEAVHEDLVREYPSTNGYHIERECLLRDETGRPAVDPETGERRRLDAVVIRDGEVVRSVEVTSETADKTGQTAKEERIREAGGDYVVDRRTGDHVPFADGVKTDVWRRA